MYVQTNFRRKIDYRWFGDAGVTWQFVRKIHSNLKLSGGLLYENTRFSVNQLNEAFYNGSENIALWRATIYLAGWHRILNGKVKLFYNTYWQTGFEQVPNSRMQVDVGLELPLWKGLGFQTEYLLAYEQVTAKKVKEIDRLLTFGLSYQIRK